MKYYVVILIVILTIAGCLSQRYETRDGVRYRIQDRGVGPVRWGRVETKDDPEERAADHKAEMKERKAEAMANLVPRGAWLLTIGLVVGAVGVAFGLVATNKMYQGIAIVAAVIGGGVAVSGLALIGIGLTLVYFLIGLAVLVAVAAIVYFREHEFSFRRPES